MAWSDVVDQVRFVNNAPSQHLLLRFLTSSNYHVKEMVTWEKTNDSEEEGSCEILDSEQANMHDNLNHDCSSDEESLGYKKGVSINKTLHAHSSKFCNYVDNDPYA